MKFIHLSDLHLGKKLYEYSMIRDQEYILDQILGIIDSSGAEGVLIAGDVYDKTVPSAEAVMLFDRFLTGLSEEKSSCLHHQRKSRFQRASGLRIGNHEPQRHSSVSCIFRRNPAGDAQRRIRPSKRLDVAVSAACGRETFLPGGEDRKLQRCHPDRHRQHPAG